MRIDASPSGPSRPSAASSVAMPSATAASTSSGRAISRPVRRSMEPGEVLGAARSGGRRALGASRRPRRRAGTRDRTPTGARRRRQELAVDPDVRSVASVAHIDLLAADGAERAARLGHGLVPLGGRIAAPGDAAADVERQPPPVRDERPDEDARLHRPVRPDPAERAGVRPAPDRLEALEDLHRPDLRGAGDRAARERSPPAGRTRRGPAARWPVTVDTRCWTAAVRSRRHSRGTRTVPGSHTRPRSLRSTSTIITFSARSLALASSSQASRPVLGAVAAAGPRALDRVRGDEPVRVDREERLRRGGQERARPAGLRRRPEVEVRGEQRRIAGPQPAVVAPRVAVERRLQPARQVGLVDVAAGDVLAGRARRRPRIRRVDRDERKRRRSPRVGPAAVARSGAAASADVPRDGRRQPRVDVVEAPREPAAVAVEGPAAEPGVARSVDPRPRPSRAARGGAAAGPGRRPRSTGRRSSACPRS